MGHRGSSSRCSQRCLCRVCGGRRRERRAKPANITYAQAAGLGIATVTGVRVVDDTKIAKGQRVLITGRREGGVGSAAAQAAKARGAYVIGTASARHNDYLRSIGVDQVIDYTKVDFEKQVGHVDAVIDTVGGETATRAMSTLTRGAQFAARGRTTSTRSARQRA